AISACFAYRGCRGRRSRGLPPGRDHATVAGAARGGRARFRVAQRRADSSAVSAQSNTPFSRQRLRAYHCAAMASKRTAIVLGGSGSVGAALIRELVRDDGFDDVIALSRQSLPESVAMAPPARRRLVGEQGPPL